MQVAFPRRAGSLPPPAPRWDQHQLDRQIRDLVAILTAQVVEFDTARQPPWITVQPAGTRPTRVG